jgi:hypothetical protein
VALSEWASCLENAVSFFNAPHTSSAKGRLVRKKSSLQVLEEIDKMVANVFTLKMVLKSSASTRAFKAFLDLSNSPLVRCSSADVDFLNAVDTFTKSKASGLAVYDKAKPIWDLFCRNENKDTHVHLPLEIYRAIEEKLPETTSLLVFTEAYDYVKMRLEADFREFTKTKDFELLKRNIDRQAASKIREVLPFKDGYQQAFILKVNKQKRSKEVMFSRRQCVFTIGRDKSNVLMIDDSRVSRSHARVEYSERQCEYIDLGSSCGSKLNGKSVLRAKLQSGDVIELGQSTLIFTLKKRPKLFSFLSFGRKSD